MSIRVEANQLLIAVSQEGALTTYRGVFAAPHGSTSDRIHLIPLDPFATGMTGIYDLMHVMNRDNPPFQLAFNLSRKGEYPSSIDEKGEDRYQYVLFRSSPGTYMDDLMRYQANVARSGSSTEFNSLAGSKVFALQHAQASDVAEILKQVYDKGPAKIVPDARTNSVIVTGPDGQLREIEALLLKLDESGQGQSGAKAVPAENEAAKLVVLLQDEMTKLQQILGPKHPKIDELQALIDTARKSPENSTFKETDPFSPYDPVQWNLMASEIAMELSRDQEAYSRLNSPNFHGVDYFQEAIDSFQGLHGARFFMETEIARFSAECKMKYQPLIEKGADALRAERDQLIEKNFSENDDKIVELELLTAWATVQQRYRDRDVSAQHGVGPALVEDVVGVSEGSPKELQQQIAQLRKDYEAADQQAHQLAAQLKQSPDAAKQAELRKAVQLAFATRQSLLRAELMEMQTRLLQTQRSIEMRERISDQIIQRRVEDLLNPQLEWEGSPTAPGTPVSQTGTRKVLVAIKGIQPLDALTKVNVQFKDVLVTALESKNGDVVETFEEYQERSVTTPVVAGDVIRKSKLTEKDVFSAARQIPKGMRIFTFTATDAHTHSGMLRPGDEVDVTVSFRTRDGQQANKVLLECVEVFACENRTLTSDDKKQEPRPRNISLLVTPEQDGFVKIAQSRGQLSLALRHPDDDEVRYPNGINSAVLDELKQSVGILEVSADPQAALLAKLQGAWVLDGKLDGDQIMVEIRDKVMTWSSETPLKPGDGKPPIFLIKLDEPGTPQTVDLTMNPNDGPERKVLLGIIEIRDDLVRFCVNMDDSGLRPELFAIGKAADLWTLRRPAKTSSAFLGVQLAPAPVGSDQLKDTPFRGGLRIEKVYTGTPAAEGGMLAGDVLVGLGAWEIAKLEDLQYALGLSLEGEVSFHILRDGQVRKGYVLLDGSARPASDKGLTPEQLVKFPVEVDRGISTPTSTSDQQVPSVDPKIAILAMLQGNLTVETTVIQAGKTTVSNPITAVGEGIRVQFASEDGQPPMSFEFILGAAGPPQQVDLRPIPMLDTDEISKKGVPKELFPFLEAEMMKQIPLLPGIVEVDGDCVRISFAAEPEKSKARPTEFKAGPSSVTWEFRPQAAAAKTTTSAAVTELEGDWHLETQGMAGQPSNNLMIRGDQYKVSSPNDTYTLRMTIDQKARTIQLSSPSDQEGLTKSTYELSGDRLTMRSGDPPQVNVWSRGHRSWAATELEGDWHGVAYYDHEGKPQETLPSNRSFRGDQSSFVGPGYRHDCRIKVDPIKKTLWSYSKEEDGSFGQDYYELNGDQLILRNEPGAVGYQIFERGLVRIPSVVPPANEEQKLLWRSAIVEIVTYGDSHVNNGGENVVGRGVVVSPGGLILAHLAGRWEPPLKDQKVMAKFDDGSQIPLTVVEEGDGFIALQPEKPINANHYFKVSQTVVQPHDEVRIWGPDHSQAGSQSLAPYADRVTVLDRKYPALGIAVWQLRFSHHAVLGTPILDADGDLLGITITGTRDLLLAVPVEKLKELFPRTLGQPPVTSAPSEPTADEKTRWRSAMVELYASKPGEDESKANRIGDGVLVSGKAEIVAYLPGVTDLASMTISAEFADGGRLDLELGEPSTRTTGNGMYCFRPKDERFRKIPNLVTFLPLAEEVPNQSVDRLYIGELFSPATISRGANSRGELVLGDPGIVNEHFANMWKIAPQPPTVRLGGKRRSDVTIAAGDPILSRDGNLVGMMLSADPEFLALPVAELKELFPKTFSSATEPEPKPGADMGESSPP